MTMTVEDVIHRCYRRYLAPAYDLPVSSTLTSALTSSTVTTVTLDPFSSIEYADAIQRGGMIEIGEELMRVTDVVDPTGPSDNIILTVIRGVSGSTATTHAIADEVIVAPTFPRMDVALAVYDEIENLHPDLWVVRHDVWDSAPYEMPDDFGDLLEVVIDDGYQRWPVHEAYVYRDQIGDVLLNIGGYTEYPITVTYAGTFPRPTKNTQTLDQLGLQERWADIIAMGAAIQFLTGQNITDLRADYLTEIEEIGVTEQVNPQDIENSLRRARAIRLNEERRRLRARERGWTQVRSPLGI